jgi:hypothetical protein
MTMPVWNNVVVAVFVFTWHTASRAAPPPQLVAATPTPPAPIHNYVIFTSPAAPAMDSRFGSTELTNMEMAGIVVSIVVGGLFFIIVLIKLGAIFVRWWSGEKDGAASLDEARSRYNRLCR